MAIRSEESRQAVLQAALDLLGLGEIGSGVTVQKLTIEAMAKHAGVSKATIYRWWPSKAAVVIDAFVAEYLTRTPVSEGLPFIEALTDHVSAVARQFGGADGRIIAQLIAESQYDEEVLAQFHLRFWDARRDAVVKLMERGKQEGVLRPDVDSALAATLVYAPIYHRLLLREGEFTEEFARAMLALGLSGILAPDAQLGEPLLPKSE